MEITYYSVNAHIEKPLRFAFVSDLHDTPNEPILNAINGQQIDAVLVGGDFIHNEVVYERGLKFLRLSSEKHPTFCILGNHEKRFMGDIRKLVNGTGVRLLDNEFERFEGIVLGGLSSGYGDGGHDGVFQKTPPPKTEWLKEFGEQKGYKLLINHHPEYFEPYLKETTIDLILSGHAHGGQWRFFGQGIFASGQGFFPKYTWGMYDERMIVGRGLGNYNPIPRFFNKPELVIITLKKEKEKC